MSDKTGIAWTDATCLRCRGHRFGAEGRCLDCRNARARSRYERKPSPGPFGPAPLPARDGDKRQARHRVNHLVDIGRIPDPDDLPCEDCADMTFLTPTGRHEYDHALGYDGDNQLYVEPVCSTCHHNREELRRNG